MIIAAAIAAATAVNAGAYTWSLDSCIAYAHANNISVRQRQVEKLNAEYGVTEAKDRFLPTVSAGASQSFDFGRGLTSENTYANRNTSSFGWQAGVNLPIFQGLAGVLMNIRRLFSFVHRTIRQVIVWIGKNSIRC